MSSEIAAVVQSGRFETHTKICLSISSYHPEQWQPSWSIRTALTALIAFFPSPAKGAVGSQEATESERAMMALESRSVPTSHHVLQVLIMHRWMCCDCNTAQLE